MDWSQEPEAGLPPLPEVCLRPIGAVPLGRSIVPQPGPKLTVREGSGHLSHFQSWAQDPLGHCRSLPGAPTLQATAGAPPLSYALWSQVQGLGNIRAAGCSLFPTLAQLANTPIWASGVYSINRLGVDQMTPQCPGSDIKPISIRGGEA